MAPADADDGGGFGGLHELYGEMILDHNRRPRNFGRLPAASHRAVGHNPLCGDRVAVYLRVAAGRIEEIAFEGVGCAISTASASMMTEALRGKTLEEARQLFERFHALVTQGTGDAADARKLAGHGGGGGAPAAGEGGIATAGGAAESAGAGSGGAVESTGASAVSGSGAPELGKLAAFAGVREFPMRVKCATLAWHAVQAALASPGPVAAPVKTE